MCWVCTSRRDDTSSLRFARASTLRFLASPSEPAGVFYGLDDAQWEAGEAFLQRWPTVDIHAHPGRFFLPSADVRPAGMEDFGEPYVAEAVDDMRAGGVSAVAFATVADSVILGLRPIGLGPVRDFRPGEAIADHEVQMRRLDELVAAHGLPLAISAADVRDAFARGKVACIKTVEGGDFIEDRLERLAEARERGVRAITLIHYRSNQIGDTQTDPDVHGGLTALGREIVSEMNHLDVLIDLSHATYATTLQAVRASRQPMLLSHSNIALQAQHPRLVSPDHARVVTEAGGLIGAAPAGFAGERTFGDYIDRLLRMIDIVGPNHIAIGTDMDFTFRPVFTSYRDWAALPATLLARGFAEEEVAKVLGGNYLRIFDGARRTNSGNLH